MREKILGLSVLAIFLIQPGVAFAQSDGSLASCHEGSGELISQALVNQTAQITDDVAEKPSGDQIKLLDERVIDLQNAAQEQKKQALLAEQRLQGAGSCGESMTQAQCIQEKINQDEARLQVLAKDTPARADTQAEIGELQVQLNAPKTLNETSANFSQASGDLHEMIETGDFSYKKHFGIIGKALLSSWKQLLTPGPIIAVSAGMGGYGVARATSLNDNANQTFTENPAPSTASKISDQMGYAYPVLAPFFIVAAITKNDNTMKTFDALAVGSAVSQAIVEPLKYAVHEERPNQSDNLGFPSGHAAETFMMATVLDHEYPGHHHLVGAAAYAGAATVSFFRVWERNHSPGEIFAGMGIGIASGIAASRAVDNEFDAAEGKRRSYWKDAAIGNFRIPKTDKVIHCVPIGTAGSCAMSW